MSVNLQQLKNILEAAMLAAGEPLSVERLLGLFPEDARPETAELRQALKSLEEDCAERGVELKEVSSGFRLQVKRDLAPWVSRLYEERAPRYSRALLETLVLIAYRQPITRGEIEDIRGVTVSTNIIKTLQEREWIRVVGHREVPGKPALFGTTREFLDYFNLKSLGDLPSLAEIRSLEVIAGDLAEVTLPETKTEEPEAAAVEAVTETEETGAAHTVH
ncbi:MAG: SMC-Scp complex subunit ScpB [Gammaproteobacteria bacterium]|jgi:segregation and condensation protein B